MLDRRFAGWYLTLVITLILPGSCDADEADAVDHEDPPAAEESTDEQDVPSIGTPRGRRPPPESSPIADPMDRTRVPDPDELEASGAAPAPRDP